MRNAVAWFRPVGDQRFALDHAQARPGAVLPLRGFIRNY
jgi:hypothetical protein